MISTGKYKLEEVIQVASKSGKLLSFLDYMTSVEPFESNLRIISTILQALNENELLSINPMFMKLVEKYSSCHGIVADMIVRRFITTDSSVYSDLCIALVDFSSNFSLLISNSITKFFPQTSLPHEQQIRYMNCTFHICQHDGGITMRVLSRVFQHMVALDCELLIKRSSDNTLLEISDEDAGLYAPQMIMFMSFLENSSREVFTLLLQLFDLYLLDLPSTSVVQFLFFYAASFNSELMETLVGFLLHKLIDNNTSLRARKNSALYISSLLARAKYIDDEFSAAVVDYVENYAICYSHHIHQEAKDLLCRNVSQHAVFYYAVQCIAYVCCWRWNSWNQNGINPLNRWRLMELVKNELAGWTAIDKNTVEQFSIILNTDLSSNEAYIDRIDVWFPFDPCGIDEISERVSPIYREWGDTQDLNDIDGILDHGIHRICANRGISIEALMEQFVFKKN